MIELVREVKAPRPVAEVADYRSDFRTTAEWDPHTESCERIDSGPLGPGARFANTQRFGPLKTTLDYEVEDYRPGRSIRLHSSGRALEATDLMEYQPDATGGTVVTYTARFSFRGPLRLLEPLARPLLSRVADQGAAGMRRTLTS